MKIGPFIYIPYCAENKMNLVLNYYVGKSTSSIVISPLSMGQTPLFGTE